MCDSLDRNQDIWVCHFFFEIVTVDDLLSKTSRLLWWSPPIVCWALHIENRYSKFFKHRMFNLQIIHSTRTAYHITKIATAFFEENKMLKTMHPLNLTEITFLLTILTSCSKWMTSYRWHINGHKCWSVDWGFAIRVWHSDSHLASLVSDDKNVTSWSMIFLASWPFRSAKKRTFLAVFIHVCLDTKRDCKKWTKIN